MRKLKCLSIQEKENTKLIYGEQTIVRKAEYHNWSLKLSTSARARPTPQHGGRRGPWGPQPTGLMPKVLGQWGLKDPEHDRNLQYGVPISTDSASRSTPSRCSNLMTNSDVFR